MVLILFFYMWTSSFTAPFVEIFFIQCVFCHLCQIADGCSNMYSLFMVFHWSICLFCASTMLFLLLGSLLALPLFDSIPLPLSYISCEYNWNQLYTQKMLVSEMACGVIKINREERGRLPSHGKGRTRYHGDVGIRGSLCLEFSH